MTDAKLGRMSTTTATHRTFGGTWETCAAAEACPLAFHVELSIAEAEALPELMLEQIAEIFDPPAGHASTVNTSRWFDASSHLHRDYDLPAVIGKHGKRQWYQHGKRHRNGDKPAVVRSDRALMWWQDGLQHRDDGKPAVIYPSGKVEYWVHGVRQHTVEAATA